MWYENVLQANASSSASNNKVVSLPCSIGDHWKCCMCKRRDTHTHKLWYGVGLRCFIALCIRSPRKTSFRSRRRSPSLRWQWINWRGAGRRRRNRESRRLEARIEQARADNSRAAKVSLDSRKPFLLVTHTNYCWALSVTTFASRLPCLRRLI